MLLMLTNGRALARYKENAERLNIPLEEYIEQGEAGKRYCSVCLKWKQRSSFLEYAYTLSYYSGICKACSPGKSAHKSQNKATWGPSIRAAAKLGISVKLYLEKRAQNLRWCSDHQEWFDATELLEGNNPSITRCKEANRTRQQEFRELRKKRKQSAKNETKSLETFSELDGSYLS